MSKLPLEIPQICPKCGKKLSHTNAIDTCKRYVVFCSDSLCRWIDIYHV